MQILIVTTKFFPYGSATSGVVGNLAQSLVNRGCGVKIIALTRYNKSLKDNYWQGIPVHFEYAPSLITKEQVFKEWRTHFIRTLHGISLRFIDKLLQLLYKKYNHYTISYSQLRAYKASLRKESLNDYDICIATIMPIEALYAAILYKKYFKKIGIYQLDPYWNNDDFPLENSEMRKSFEYSLVMESDLCLTTPIIQKINTKEFPELKEKYLSVEFPCIRRPICEEIKKIDSRIHCVFVGMLYLEIRPPEKVVDIISALVSQDIIFDFFGDGQNLVTQSRNYEKAKNRILLHGVITSEEAEKERVKADFLVNIDNTSTVLVPSKIFEYISTGKPIINFYFSKESQTLKYLEKYPLCINIYLYDDYKNNAVLIDDFIRNHQDERISFDTIRNIYWENTPECVSEQLINILKK